MHKTCIFCQKLCFLHFSYIKLSSIKFCTICQIMMRIFFFCCIKMKCILCITFYVVCLSNEAYFFHFFLHETVNIFIKFKRIFCIKCCAIYYIMMGISAFFPRLINMHNMHKIVYVLPNIMHISFIFSFIKL